MLGFDPLQYRYPSHRNVVYAAKGMACSSVPQASQIGIETMKKGGNAIDASIAMAAALPFLEPTGNGLGSDCFVLVWTGGKLYGLNGSGFSPKALSAGSVAAAGCAGIPLEGWLPVMVPGCPATWAALRRRFGTMTMKELLAPAVRYAREGSPVPVNVARQWGRGVRQFDAARRENPALFTPFMETFAKDGAPYGAGELFRCGDMADTLEELAETECESFYRGGLMKKIVAFSQKTGGFFSESDFTDYRAEWTEPISIRYKGYDVFEMPPNGHGITALMALNILGEMDLGGSRDDTACYHSMIEATKLAFADARKYVSDPRTMRTRVEDLLSDTYARRRRALIGARALFPEAGDPACGGTVYFCTADSRGNMVSFIQSNYMGFGSGVVIPGTGISLQNRGANFSLDPESDNFLAGGKRAYHTIIPGFLAKDGQPVGPFGVMGGFMQPQGHVQVVVNTVDFGMNPQECLDAPRFQWTGGRKVQLEPGVPARVARELAAMGHEVEIVRSGIDMGRGEIIWRLPGGVLAGGAEPRCDGAAAPW